MFQEHMLRVQEYESICTLRRTEGTRMRRMDKEKFGRKIWNIKPVWMAKNWEVALLGLSCQMTSAW